MMIITIMMLIIIISCDQALKIHVGIGSIGIAMLCYIIWSSTRSTADAGNVRFNTLDGRVDRRSHTGVYDVINGIPR